MPGLDLTQVSSNWKQLQGRIEREKKAAQSSQSQLKRKRSEEEKKKPLPHYVCKLIRLSGANTDKLGNKRRKMGTADSKPAGTTTSKSQSTTTHAQLAKQHNLDPSDISAAYGHPSSHSHTNSTLTRPDDALNAGLDLTRKAGKFLALDCEMVGTGPPPYTDNVLARASVVNFHGEQIYDSYVCPPPGTDVRDYRTHVSGIRASHMLEGYARPFAKVQKDIAALLEGRVLVGHALRNDLQALQITHAKRDMRDTSRYAKFRIESRGKPPALRNLMKSQFGIVMQTGEHSSVEDARATMMLFKREKGGFEEENRKVFGQARRKVGGENDKEGEEDDASKEKDKN